MKKDVFIGFIIAVIVILMGISVKSGKSLRLPARLYDPKAVLENQVPIFKLAKEDKTAFHEEDENTDTEIKIEIDGAYSDPVVPKNKARVLIYHTHINEAYARTDSYTYEESGTLRTTDKSKNVARVGDELTKLLEKEYGMEVVHDTTDFEPPRLGTAYSRSLEMLEKRKKEGEFDIYLDIHRDSFEYNPNEIAVIDGERVARIMLVVGTGEGNKGTPILPRPDYKSNYAYAKQITDNINKQIDGLAKEVRVNKSRYNQHISKKAVLIEMGYTGNNMDEVLKSVPYLAKAIADTVQK